MKIRAVFLVMLCIFVFPIYLSAQELPEQYREKFSESYPIRKKQNSDMNQYLDRLIEKSRDECIKFFSPDFSGTEQYEESLSVYRKKFLQKLGYPPPEAKEGTVPKIVKVGEDVHGVIYRVWLEVMDGVDAYGIYMVPRSLKGKAPLIICVHGSGGCPEAVCDLDTGEPLHAMGKEIVKRGYILWAPALDVRNYYGNEVKLPESNRHVFAMKAKPVGTSFEAIQMYKIIRTTKALIKQCPEIDSEKVGMTGLSLGGFFTIYTTAVFPFIKVSAPSAYFVERARRYVGIKSGGTTERAFFNILNTFGFAQVTGMICPRPLMVQLGINDRGFHTESSLRELRKAQAYYRKLGIIENFEYYEHPGGHEYHVESILAFFDKYLK